MFKKAPGMAGMLPALNLKLEGKHHSGIDDSKNIAKIALELLKRGGVFSQF
jgi:ERI1 exoribonuclease 3